MDFRPVFYVNGILLLILSVGMFVPMLTDIYFESLDWKVFFVSILITSFFGGSLVLSNSGQELDINIRQAFLITIASWLTTAAFGAIPLYLSRINLSITDAFFESMSGITTTGATILTDIEDAPPGILMWRGILQWFGGIGFIVMAMSILPLLKVGGMRLFRTESSESEKALPRAAQLASSIGSTYVGLTLLCLLSYMFAGQNIFDASIHAMTTLSTGGFSTYNASFAAFDTIWSEITAIVFMTLGGLPFILYIKAAKGNFTPLFKDTQVRWFLGIVLSVSFVLAFFLVKTQQMSPLQAIVKSLFNVISIVTTTGFVSSDYALWGTFAFSVFFFLTFIGACAGSTAGGIKIFRAQVLFAITKVQTKKLLHPNGVFLPHYNGRPIPKDVTMSVMGFFFIFVFICSISTILLTVTGLDFLTAVTAAGTALANVGPGFGEIIGPTGNFAPLPAASKWILSFLMLLGRLEIYTALVLLSPHFWQR